MNIFDNIRVKILAWVERLTVGTNDVLGNVKVHIKGDEGIVLTGESTTYPAGNSKPTIEMRNMVDPAQSDGAGGVLKWTSWTTGWKRKIAGYFNAGFITNTEGKEDTCYDLGLYRNGKWEVMAVRGDWNKIYIPPGWDFGDLNKITAKIFSGGLETLAGPDGIHKIEFKWVWPPGVIEFYVDGVHAKTL